MATRNKVVASVRPPAPRPTAAERRAAQIAMLSTQQADLKQAAAQRREQRGEHDDAPAPATSVDGATGTLRSAV